MDFTEKLFNSFLVAIGFGFIIFMFPILEGVFVPALNADGAVGNIGWVNVVLPVVFDASIFFLLVLFLVKIWRSENEASMPA